MIIGCIRFIRTRKFASDEIRYYRGHPLKQAWGASLRSECSFDAVGAHRRYHLPRQKLISGRYLGEILRLIICELIDDGVLFLGQETYKIEVPYAFDTAFLSLMER